ncbi:hypothetical protein GCM10009809_27420 [Isoptericola hypogeus]|uniref:Bifunctional folate synthesis protein n=1 Tax=Isoptericola hypogeus TaxID=300179 RepID=A0ABN2JKF8_9MICO
MTFAAAVPGPHGQPLDQIRLDGVSATGHHGVLPHERAEGQVFRADVVLHLDTRAAASSDDLAATVSYADVAQDVHDVLAGSPADLVETVAERIAAVVLDRPAVHTVDVRVHKPQAPIEVPFDDVSVVVRRDRAHAPVVAAPLALPQAQEPLVEPVETPVAAVPAALPLAQQPPAEPVETPPAVDPLDAVPEQPVEAVLALGANLGDAQVTLREAVTDIDRIPGIQVTDVSPLARTAAVGGPEQPDYLNAVLVVRTALAPRDLLRAVQEVEARHGRVRDERWGPRTLDVDIVQYGTLTSTAPELELPHPRAHERAFVLVPWAEVAPDAVLGGLGGGVVGQLAVTAPDRAGIRWLALDWLTGPTQSTGQVVTDAGPAPSAPVPQASEPEAVPGAPVPQASEPEAVPGAPVPAPAPEQPPAPGPVFHVPSAPAAPQEQRPADGPPVDAVPPFAAVHPADAVPPAQAVPSPHAPVPPAPDHPQAVWAPTEGPVSGVPASPDDATSQGVRPEPAPFTPYGGEPATSDPFPTFGVTGADQPDDGRDDDGSHDDEGRDR